MRRSGRRLARLLRVLLACLVLALATTGSRAASDPVRDVSAWVTAGRVATAAPASPGPAARSGSAGTEPSPPAPGGVQLQRASLAAAAASDERYLYLELQLLRC